MKRISRRAGRALTWLTLALAAASCGSEPEMDGSDSGPPGPGAPAPGAAGPQGPPGYRLVFQDEFDGAALDTSVWNAPFILVTSTVTYTPDALTVRDGLLRIATYSEGGKHISAHLDTSGKVQPRYGYFEARIRFSSARGQWGAFWLHTPTYGDPVGDPASAGVEVDIVEYRAVNMEGQGIEDFVAMVLHWDGPTAHKRDMRFMRPPVAEPLNGHWHTYAVLWTDRDYTFYVDGMPLWTTSAAVSRRDQYICLTAPIGIWAGTPPPEGYGTRETSTTGMEVDWVRVWQKE